MNKKFKFAALALSVSLLSACGGGGSSSADTADDESLTPYTIYGSLQNQGRTESTAAGFDGDISISIDEFNDPEFELVNGIASMNVDNVQRSETYTFSCPDGSNGKVTFFDNYVTGVEEVTARVNGQTVDCSTSYPTDFFPATIGSSASISDLLFFWEASDAGEYISTNCPINDSASNPLNQDLDPNPSLCETAFFSDITVTDEFGNTHLVSFERVSIPD